MTKETDKLLSTRKVAQRLGYEGDAGLHRVQRLIDAGKLRAENHSTGDKRPQWMVRESVVRAFLEAVATESEARIEEKRSTGNFLRQERRERLRSG